MNPKSIFNELRDLCVLLLPLVRRIFQALRDEESRKVVRDWVEAPKEGKSDALKKLADHQNKPRS